MFKRYTDEAKRAVFFADVEAKHRNQEKISVNDLLIGLTWESTSRAAQLCRLKDRAVELRSMAAIPHLPSTALPYRRQVTIPLDQSAKVAIASAADEADRDREYWIDSDHLLRGILRLSHPISKALEESGIQLETVRASSRTHRQQFPPKAQPRWANVRMFASRYRNELRAIGNILLALLAIGALVLIIRSRSSV